MYELCRTAIETGTPRLQRYGISDDDAFEVGLTCGGIIDLFVERVDQTSFPELDEVSASISSGEPVAVVTCIEGPADRLGRRLVVWPDRRSGSARLATAGRRGRPTTAGACWPAAGPGSSTMDTTGSGAATTSRVFVASHAPRPRMLVFGAIDFAAAVARVGVFLGYKVTVCDAATGVRDRRSGSADADEVVVDWPHRYLRGEIDQGNVDERTVVCVLTHDPKFDVPVLEVALRQPFAYVGAMGSRRTHDDRMKRLREAGMTEDELARLASPIGLDLGARTPEETAVSIAAEIIAARWGGGGARLTETAGRIHHEPMHDGDPEPAPVGRRNRPWICRRRARPAVVRPEPTDPSEDPSA